MGIINSPAKLNLFLHVLNKRNDGYHLLESGVVFINLYDVITIKPAHKFSLTITGEFASSIDGLNIENNIITKAIRILEKENIEFKGNYEIRLEKNIPIAAGLGGGSSNSAGILLYFNQLCNLNISQEKLHNLALILGADVPMFLYQKPAIMSGIGEKLEFVTLPNNLFAVLVNPRKTLDTATIFKNLTPDYYTGAIKINKNNVLNEIINTNNDLEKVAIKFVPEIKTIIQELGNYKGCILSRMSGSGATCFALFNNEDLAKKALEYFKITHPHWWVKIAEVKI